MRRIFVLAVLSSVTASAIGDNSLADKELENFCKQVIRQRIMPIEDETSFCSAVVLENGNGAVRALVNRYTGEGGEWRTDYSYEHHVHAAHQRLALYLALLEAGLTPSDVFTATGCYVDPESHAFIQDIGWLKHRPQGAMPLEMAVGRSDVALLLASEVGFGKSMAQMAVYLNRTGVWLGDHVKETEEEIFKNYENTPWSPIDVLSYRDQAKPIQIAVYMMAIARNGNMISPRFSENEPVNELYKQISHRELIDSVRKSLRHYVTDGFSRRANSKYAKVSGLTIVSQENVVRERCFTFGGYTKDYTVVINCVKRGLGGRAIVNDIAQEIIDFLSTKGKTLSADKNTTPEYIHPAAR